MKPCAFLHPLSARREASPRHLRPMRGHVLLQYYARARMAPPAYIVTLATKATAAVSFLYDILTLPAYSRPLFKNTVYSCINCS